MTCPTDQAKEIPMSRFRMQNHTIWHCLYHFFLPKYWYNILKNNVAKEVYNCLQTIAGRDGCEIAELNVQEDRVHMMIYIPLISQSKRGKEL